MGNQLNLSEFILKNNKQNILCYQFNNQFLLGLSFSSQDDYDNFIEGLNQNKNLLNFLNVSIYTKIEPNQTFSLQISHYGHMSYIGELADYICFKDFNYKNDLELSTHHNDQMKMIGDEAEQHDSKFIKCLKVNEFLIRKSGQEGYYTIVQHHASSKFHNYRFGNISEFLGAIWNLGNFISNKDLSQRYQIYQRKISLLIGRKYCPSCPFHQDNFPLDMFKLIWYLL